MNDSSQGIFALIAANRASALELALVVLAAALGVNLVSTFLGTVVPAWISLSLGIILILASLGLLVWLRLKPISFDRRIEGFLVYDRAKNELVRVDNYELSEESTRLLASAFAENAALRRQWQSSPLSTLDEDSATPPTNPEKSRKLIKELLEYIILESLSVHLSDFFNSTEFEEAELSTYSRNDVPQVLLANRFLELFSRVPENRAIFTEDNSRPPVNEEAVMSISRNGAYFSRFSLSLPKHSTLSRTSSGDIQIDGPLMSVCINTPFNRYSTLVPFTFLQHYLGPNMDDYELGTLAVKINVQIKIHKQLRANKSALKYNKWVEDFLSQLEDTYSSDVFFSRIGWTQIEAALHVLEMRVLGSTEKADEAAE